MGCGESKHAVATTEPVSISKRWTSFSRKSSKNSEAKNETPNNNENVGNGSSSEPKGQEEIVKETKEKVEELQGKESTPEKFSVNEANSGDKSPPKNASVEEPILNAKENDKKEISAGSESPQKEKEETTESGAENVNEDAKDANEEEATPRAEKEKNILTAMDEAAGSAKN